MKMSLRRMGCGAFLACAGLAAHSASSEDARVALRDGRYESVLQISQSVAAREPALAINWYRMAIAASRLGQHSLAGMALAQARMHDPSLSFASSPERVQSLQASIEQGVGSDGSAQQRMQDAAELFRPEDAPEQPAAVPDPVVKAEMPAELLSRLDAIDREIQEGLQRREVQQDAGMLASVSPWLVGFCLLALAVAFGVAVVIGRHVRALRQMRGRDLAGMPLAELMAEQRDAISLLGQRLEWHGHKNTALYQSLGGVLSTLELECGRSAVELEPLVKGRVLADAPRALEPALPVLGIQSSQEVHQAVLDSHLRAAHQSSLLAA